MRQHKGIIWLLGFTAPFFLGLWFYLDLLAFLVLGVDAPKLSQLPFRLTALPTHLDDAHLGSPRSPQVNRLGAFYLLGEVFVLTKEDLETARKYGQIAADKVRVRNRLLNHLVTVSTIMIASASGLGACGFLGVGWSIPIILVLIVVGAVNIAVFRTLLIDDGWGVEAAAYRAFDEHRTMLLERKLNHEYMLEALKTVQNYQPEEHPHE